MNRPSAVCGAISTLRFLVTRDITSLPRVVPVRGRLVSPRHWLSLRLRFGREWSRGPLISFRQTAQLPFAPASFLGILRFHPPPRTPRAPPATPHGYDSFPVPRRTT